MHVDQSSVICYSFQYAQIFKLEFLENEVSLRKILFSIRNLPFHAESETPCIIFKSDIKLRYLRIKILLIFLAVYTTVR